MQSLPFTLALVLTSVVVAARASADDRAIAQQAFQEGRDLMAAGNVAEACPKFAAAAQLSQTAGVRLNLADCYAKLGKTASAWSKAGEALDLAERAGDTAAAGLARDQMTALKPNLSYMTITVAKGLALQGLEIALDGEKIPEPVWETAFPVDPGEHEIAARAPGRKPWSMKTIVAGAAARATVAVPALAVESAPPAPQPASAAPEPSTAGGGWARGTAHTLAIVSGSVGLVGLGVGTTFGLVASSKKSDYQQHEANGHCIDAQCASISKDAVSAATLSTIGFVAGGVLAAAGVVLWLTAPSNRTEGRSAAIAPMAGPQGLGAGVSGSW